VIYLLDASANDSIRFWVYGIAALHGLLNKIRDLGFTLLAVNRVESD
jgi:hypothetical protein